VLCCFAKALHVVEVKAMADNPYSAPQEIRTPPEVPQDIAGAAHWLRFAAGGAVLGAVFLSKYLRGASDPTGYLVAPVLGAAVGLIVAAGRRAGWISK
jgi:hypothetical protein